MASSGKRKTTMAKLTRESRLREKRAEKQARKTARKLAPAEEPFEAQDEAGTELLATDGELAGSDPLPLDEALTDA
jgi:hypothetical protein